MAGRDEPLSAIKSRRDSTLNALVAHVPYVRWLGMRFDRCGDELTAILPFSERLVGNPRVPAIHGGVTAAFLEVAAIVELTWASNWADMEEGRISPRAGVPDSLPLLPRTIDITVDYLRAGLLRDCYARARVVRSGRRYASVHVEAWQDQRQRLFAQATGHFLMPQDG